MKEMAMVRNADGEELFLGETIGKCKEWCESHSIDGSNGEYIATGRFYVSDRYFEVEDYELI